MREKNELTFAQARDLELVEYLGKLGIEPQRIRGVNYWYISPFRDEKTASFKINTRLNRWYDFGEGLGGSIIDLVMKLKRCSALEALNTLSENVLIPFVKPQRLTKNEEEESKISILSVVKPIGSTWLLNYLFSRSIPLEIGKRFLAEITYQVNRHNYTALGFQNQSGGWELRSPFFKGSSTPKDYTYFNYGHQILLVFEGFFDFLSFVQIYHTAQKVLGFDFLILNSIVFFSKASPLMGNYEYVHLYFDNDAKGRETTLAAKTLGKHYLDKSFLYANHNDLNAMLSALGIEHTIPFFIET